MQQANQGIVVTGIQSAAPEWSFIGGNEALGIQYSIDGDSTCTLGGGNATYVTIVQFQCAAEPGLLSVTNDNCTFTYVVPTPLSCPAPSPLCGFHGVDLSPLRGRDYFYSASTPMLWNYTFSVCGAVLSDPLCLEVSPSASTCANWEDGAQMADVLGDFGPAPIQQPVWSFINGDSGQGIQYQIESLSEQWSVVNERETSTCVCVIDC